MEGTKVIACKCEHKDQDEIYGKGMRLHNVNTKGQAFCTVCSPSYRRNKVGVDIPPNTLLNHGFIKGRGSRNAKAA